MKFHREGFNFPFSKSLSATQPRPSSRMDLSSSSPPPSTSFQVISCIKDEPDPSCIYRGQDIGYSTVEKVDAPPRSPLSPALYHFTAISGIILRPWTTHSTSRGREKFDGIGSCLKQRAWPRRERERERKGENERIPMRLVLFGNLLSESLRRIYLARLSSCAIDSTRLHFSFQVEQITASFARASFPLA